jgi:hypothetical protein
MRGLMSDASVQAPLQRRQTDEAGAVAGMLMSDDYQTLLLAKPLAMRAERLDKMAAARGGSFFIMASTPCA